MTTLFMIRHAESVANAGDILASQLDYPLSARGVEAAAGLAQRFCASRTADRVIASPLARAVETARPFAERLGLHVETDARLIEQDLGRFAGLTYAEVERDPAYRKERSARWDWVPEGGGESYRMIAERVGAFLMDLQRQAPGRQVLLVTHAVTLRLLRAQLEASLPRYPESIASNGEIWECELTQLGAPHGVSILDSERMIRRQ